MRGAARFPLLAANLSGSCEIEVGRDYFPAAIGVAGGLRSGFLGLNTSMMKHYRKAADPGLSVAMPVATLTEVLPALAALCDVVVVLSYCGYGEDYGPPRASDGWRFYIRKGDIPLARAAARLADKPVVIVDGHTHTVLNKTGLEPENLIDGVLTLRPERKTKFTARLHASKIRDDTLDKGDPDYAKAEHDGDFDRDFETRVIDPLQARIPG